MMSPFGELNRLKSFDETCNGIVVYVRDPIPHDNLVGVVQRGWSGHIRDLSYL